MDASLQAADLPACGESRDFVRQAHEILRDLLQPKPAIFWTDFLGTTAISYAALFFYLRAAAFGWMQLGAFLVCALALYRDAVFIHELWHRPPGTFRTFHSCWNLLFGIPTLMPSFLYGDHRSHHSNRSYGTGGDSEYVFLTRGRWRAAAFLMLVLVYPVLGLLRFLLLTPAALVFPPADRLVWRYASSLYMMNPAYRRDYDAFARASSRWIQEIACSLWAWCLVWWTWSGAVSIQALFKTYLVFLFWMALNQVRTLVAHRYGNDGNTRSYLGQLLDTHTFPRGVLLAELWAPLGLRYHALHHVMPSLPYHAAGEAHRRLAERMPHGSPYHQTFQDGLWPALKAAFVSRKNLA